MRIGCNDTVYQLTRPATAAGIRCSQIDTGLAWHGQLGETVNNSGFWPLQQLLLVYASIKPPYRPTMQQCVGRAVQGMSLA